MSRAQLKALAPLVPIAIAVLGIGWTVSASSAPTQQYAQYRNDRWHFSLAIPADMTVATYDEPGDGEKIRASSANADRLFVVTIAPFTLLDVAIGDEGAPNASYDQLEILGVIRVIRDDLFNVSFVKNGVAYTITTMPELEEWLISEILPTWRFTD